MLQEKRYTVSELRGVLSEANEFKAKKGDGVDKEKKYNKDGVEDIMKETGKVAKELSKNQEGKKPNPQEWQDLNKTTLEYEYAYEPDNSYKERVKKEVEGSKFNDPDPSLDYEGNKEFYKQRKGVSKTRTGLETDEKHAGLKSHNLPKETFKPKTAFNENHTKMKRLHFKNTSLLNESQVKAIIPEDYKKNGNRFVIKDKVGNEYLIECVEDKICKGFIHTQVVDKKLSETTINESLDKINHLSSYSSSEAFKGATNETRRLEESKYNEMLDHVRKLMTEGK